MNESGDKCDDSINLRTLRQIDESISSILLFGGQVAVYKYSFGINEWERKEIEGSMFVIERKVIPNYGFIVINRLNTTNMFQLIAHNMDTKVQVPYLLYKNAINEIYCIWFYNEMDCVHVSDKLQFIVNKLQTQENSQSNDNKGLTCGQSKNDILKRLLSVELNSSDSDKLQRNTTIVSNILANGQTLIPTQSQPQRRSLQVKDLFESQMASLSIASKPELPVELSQHNFDDCLILNDVITPAMLTDHNSKSKTNTTETLNTLLLNQKTTQSPIPFTPIATNYLSNSVSEKSGGIPSLTMEQLKQTLVHLLQNDADFLHSIHNAYIASINRK